MWKEIVDEYKMICDWLGSQECLFPGESSMKKKK